MISFRIELCAVLVGLFLCVGEHLSAQCEQQKIFASDGDWHDSLGWSVFLDGETLAIGAPEDDNFILNGGAVYTYQWNGSSWSDEVKLTPPQGDVGDRFGYAVCLDGDLLLAGAAQDNEHGVDSGSAYLYRWNGTSWIQEQKLVPTDGVARDQFGYSVSVNESVALVGAPATGSPTSSSGAAYVYRWDGTTWVFEQKLVASDGEAFDEFGTSVAVQGDVALVGAPGDDDLAELQTGAVYAYRFDGMTWVEEDKLLASDPTGSARFGQSLALENEVALIGALYNSHSDVSMAGAVYAFRSDMAGWVEESKLVSSDPDSRENFGWTVSLYEDIAVVGAQRTGNDEGAAYLFRNDGTQWVEQAILRPADPAAGDNFAYSVCVDGNRAVVGARNDDHFNTDCGSATVFALTDLTLVAPSNVHPGETLTLTTSGGLPLSPAMLIITDIEGTPMFLRLAMSALDAQGTWLVSLGVPPDTPSAQITLQTLGFDPCGKLTGPATVLIQ